jgi:hypothetical protein
VQGLPHPIERRAAVLHQWAHYQPWRLPKRSGAQPVVVGPALVGYSSVVSGASAMPVGQDAPKFVSQRGT